MTHREGAGAEDARGSQGGRPEERAPKEVDRGGRPPEGHARGSAGDVARRRKWRRRSRPQPARKGIEAAWSRDGVVDWT